MILLGYLSIIFYSALLILLCEKLFPKFLAEEYCRKILHIGTFANLPLANVFFGQGSIHFVVICTIFSIVTAVMYFAKLFKAVDKREKSYPGIFYYALSLLVCSTVSYFWQETSIYFAIGFIGLAFGDGFATLIGSAIKNPKIYKNKTMLGFFSCFIVTFLGIFVYDKIGQNLFSVWQILLLAMFCAIIELVDFGLDNLSIPIGLFFLSFAITDNPAVTISVLVFEIVFAIAFFSRFIEYYGALLASTIGFLFYYFTGLKGILFVVGSYAILISCSVVNKILKNDLSDVVKKTKAKDLIEIAVNGAWTITSFLLFAFTKNELFILMAFIALSEGFVDSIASDIGTLSKKKPFDLFHWKTVDKGVSGGMSLLGSIASLIGAFIFSTSITLIFALSPFYIFLIALMLYVGSFVDSLLGSLLQVKYQCLTCGKITERENHCNIPTKQIGGYRFFNNDSVNLLAGMSVFLLSFILFLF